MADDIKKQLAALEERIGVTFNRRELLLEALTHRSFRLNGLYAHNEALEFLGDAVLELVVTEFLFNKFRYAASEGELTRWRVSMVNNMNLAEVAENIGLAGLLRVSDNLRHSMEDQTIKRRILSCAFEAVIGAVYMDQGLPAARLCVDALLHARFSRTELPFCEKKTQLQELTQARWKLRVEYVLVNEYGPMQARVFCVEAQIGGMTVARAEGRSRKEASQSAADLALKTMDQWQERVQRRLDVVSTSVPGPEDKNARKKN